MAPRVTIIIPTYNWSTVLPYSIGSALRQTFTDFELLVIGDGCTDDSASVVASMDDPRVRWINREPRFGHQSGPNNEGLRQARGELIAYLGHDDLWFPHHLACAVAAIDAGADLAHSIVASVPGDGDAPRLYAATKPDDWMGPSFVVHRRRVTEAIGGWRAPGDLYIDPELDLWQRARKAGFVFTFVPRLTAVKFPAAFRRDVYKQRPCHEQAAWSRRIAEEPDLEVVELAKAVAFLQNGRSDETFVRRLLRSIIPAEWVRPFLRRKGAHIRDRQRFKGVDES